MQSRPVERYPIKNAIICSKVQLSSRSSHFAESYSGPLCSTRFFLLCPFHRLLGFFLASHLSHMVAAPPPPPPQQLIPAVQQLCHTFYCTTCILKECSLLSLSSLFVLVADYGLVADLFKVRHILAN